MCIFVCCIMCCKIILRIIGNIYSNANHNRGYGVAIVAQFYDQLVLWYMYVSTHKQTAHKVSKLLRPSISPLTEKLLNYLMWL
jgi:hypothetical protein